MTETYDVSIESRLALARRALELERRKLELLRENQIEFYCPHPKQADFHAAALYHYRYARTGNRFGKSEMGACEDVAYALGYRPWIPEGNPRRTLGIPPHPIAKSSPRTSQRRVSIRCLQCGSRRHSRTNEAQGLDLTGV